MRGGVHMPAGEENEDIMTRRETAGAKVYFTRKTNECKGLWCLVHPNNARMAIIQWVGKARVDIIQK